MRNKRRSGKVDYIRRAQEVIDIEAGNLQRAGRNLGKEFSDAVRMILDCLNKGAKIVVTGMGKNLHIAQKISSTLASTGSTSVWLNPAQALHGDLGILSEGDVLLALSYSGESDELTSILPIVKRLGVKIIALTGETSSSLAKYSEVVIPASVEREACPFNMAPTCSTTVALAIGDALAMVLLDARGFKKEDYAMLHPGGAIGRALLLRVSDIMRTGDKVAVVKNTAKVKDAVVAMTQARAGSAGIVDTENKMLGIFTDGDLRRYISKHPNVLELPIEQVMTRAPITVKADQLAVDVLRIYESHNIDDLLVVDDSGRLVGAVDIQDLPKLKIM